MPRPSPLALDAGREHAVMERGLIVVGVAFAVGIADAQPPAEPEAPAGAVGDQDQPEPAEEGAATRLPPVVVTARKWEELARDLPLSITVVPGSVIEDAGLRTVRDAAAYVPNMLVTEFTARRLSFPFIRGIGAGQGEPAVTTYIDGVPQLTTSSTNVPLLDIERIEFLRGPNGTLYGRNALGGIIQVISRRPSLTPEFKAALTIGNFDHQEYQLSYSTPLVAEELFLSLSGVYSRRDGYTKNDVTGSQVDGRDGYFGRGQLLWTPDERTEIRVIASGEDSRDGGFALFDLDQLRARPYHLSHDFEGKADRDLWTTAVTWTHSGDAFEFTSISAYEDWEIEELADFDFTAVDAIRRRTTESQKYFNQELRLSSPADGALPLSEGAGLKWLAGIQGFYADSKRASANDFRPGGAGVFFPPAMVGVDRSRGDFDDYAFNLFGQLTLALDEKLELTAGLGWDYERKKADIDQSFEVMGFPVFAQTTRQTEDFDELTPRFSAAYRWTEGFMTYGSAARGFQAGGFNLTAPPGQLAFGTETNWTYEAGVKTSWLDERLTVNAAVFYIDWDDMQLNQFDVDFGGFVTNAGESTSQGVEVEWAARVSPELDLFGSFGYTDTEFDQFVDQFGIDDSGHDLPFAPQTTWQVGAQYQTDLGRDLRFFARAEYLNVGTFHYDPSNLARESYELANFRAGVGGRHWRFEAWVRNAFDNDYVPVAFQPNPADPTVFVGENGAPRTFGVTCRVTF